MGIQVAQVLVTVTSNDPPPGWHEHILKVIKREVELKFLEGTWEVKFWPKAELNGSVTVCST